MNFLAIDLGASSGRGVIGRLEGGRLVLDEVHRFANGPVTTDGSLRWDVEALEAEIRRAVALARQRVGRLAGIGVDSWGVDYVLLDAAGEPVEPPYHYRDRRTDGVMARVCDRIGREALFSRTGIQFMPFNTIFQLAAHERASLRRASGLLMIADYFACRLAGRCDRPAGEVTLASTSQLLDARTRRWSAELIESLSIQPGLMPALVEAGHVLGDCDGAPVIASAAHDTAAAVAGCPAQGDDWAFLSSGTWSLLGLELNQPVLSADALAFNLSNEAGVAGTTRLLRNIMGLWLVQECRREWSSGGAAPDWGELVALAESARPFAAVIDPDDATFLAPGDMPGKIAAFCQRTGQPAPDSAGQTVRVILESLALKSRWVLDRLEQVAGRKVRVIHLVGGGANNRLLCQWTADATGRQVLAGPSEATAAGNVLAQAVGAGVIESWPAARAVLRNSISLADYQPGPAGPWDEAYSRLERLMDAS